MSGPPERPPRRPGTAPVEGRPELRVREARHDDEAALARLERLGFADPWPPAALAAEIAHPGSRVLVAEESGDREVIGYLALRLLPDAVEILRVAVAPGRRRRGVGSRLIAEARRVARGSALDTCLLEVEADNLPARRLYERAGFRLTGRRPRYYPGGVDALLLERREALSGGASSGRAGELITAGAGGTVTSKAMITRPKEADAMAKLEESLRQQLLEEDDEFRRLHDEHQSYESRLQELYQKTLLSEEDELAEKQIKRHKLFLKDRMEAILRSRLAAEVPA